MPRSDKLWARFVQESQAIEGMDPEAQRLAQGFFYAGMATAFEVCCRRGDAQVSAMLSEMLGFEIEWEGEGG